MSSINQLENSIAIKQNDILIDQLKIKLHRLKMGVVVCGITDEIFEKVVLDFLNMDYSDNSDMDTRSSPSPSPTDVPLTFDSDVESDGDSLHKDIMEYHGIVEPKPEPIKKWFMPKFKPMLSNDDISFIKKRGPNPNFKYTYGVKGVHRIGKYSNKYKFEGYCYLTRAKLRRTVGGLVATQKFANKMWAQYPEL